MLQGRVEKHVEGGITDAAEHEEIGQAFFHHRPVPDKLRYGNGEDDGDGEDPAQEGEGHGADVADGQLAGNGVAAPAERGDDEGDIGFGGHADVSLLHGAGKRLRGEWRSCGRAWPPRGEIMREIRALSRKKQNSP